MALPQGSSDSEDDLAATFTMNEDCVKFATANVHIGKEGLTVDGEIVSDIRPVCVCVYCLSYSVSTA